MSQQQSAPFIARCTATGERFEVATPNEIVECYRRQRRLTGNDLEWVFADHHAVSRAPDSGDVVEVLEALDEHFDDGVPLGIIAAAMSKQGLTIGETLDALYEQRMTGRLWEPQDDHLSPV